MADVPDKFTQASEFTFHPSVEGGYTIDNGGPTNYGITQNTLDNYVKKNGYEPIDVKDISKDDAKNIANELYFKEPKIDSLPDRTAVATFDYAINSGPHQAIKDLQRTVGAEPDGRIGPQTEQAINAYIKTNGEDALLHDYTERRATLMNNLIMQNPNKYMPNAKGWANRIQNLKNYLNFSQVNQQPTDAIA